MSDQIHVLPASSPRYANFELQNGHEIAVTPGGQAGCFHVYHWSRFRDSGAIMGRFEDAESAELFARTLFLRMAMDYFNAHEGLYYTGGS